MRLVYTKKIKNEDLERKFDREALYFTYVVTKNEQFLKIYNESKGEDVQVCKALDEMFEEATNKGVKRGIEQGVLNNQREMYQKMLNKGFTIEKMADIFSVSVESIQKLITQ